MSTHRKLTDAEIQALEGNGCTAVDWAQVEVGDGFDPTRVRDAEFAGPVKVGSLSGTVSAAGGAALPAGILQASLANCDVGDDVRICRIGGHIANYIIESGAHVTDVGTLATEPGATFGNGVEAECVNEGGGREVLLFDELSSQFAYLMAMHRHNPALIDRLKGIAAAHVEKVRSDMGRIGAGATVAHVGEIIDVNIGPAARVVGPSRLHNGTILSEAGAPTEVGSGVVAQDFIIAEGATVDDGVILHASFVGQGVKMGKQYSAENSLFFANAEGFHGEACSIFAGPYTVTHHKSTLLIAGIYSFYNAGSGTNASNHMYKLGPVHQGILQRGSKNGSFSYLLWPTVVAPFSVVIGKHMTSFDAGDLPFSYITEEEGDSVVTPAMNMVTVGTIRDGEKWPARDRRQATHKRDKIRFEVYSPYTVGKMLRGEQVLTELYEKTARDVEQVRHKGAIIRRLMLRRGARNYRDGIDMYLREKILARAAEARGKGGDALQKALVDAGEYSAEWADVSGLLVAVGRLEAILADVAGGRIADAAAFAEAMAGAADEYDDDEWAWVRRTYAARAGKSVDDLTDADLDEMEKAWAKSQATFIKKVLADAEKEFDDVARFGYGADGDDAAKDGDFEEVRGNFDGNSFAKGMREKLAALS